MILHITLLSYVIVLFNFSLCLCASCSCQRLNQSLHIECRQFDQQEIRHCLENNTDAIEVYIIKSGLTSIPPSISVLTSVQLLDLSYNYIQEIDKYTLSSIGGTLQVLIMSYNNVSVLRNGSLDKLVHLKEIVMDHNCLEEIELDAINSKSGSLCNMQFSYNQMKSIDLSLLFVPKLYEQARVTVNVSNNLISNGTNNKGFRISNISLNNRFFLDLKVNKIETVDVEYFLQITHIETLTDLYNLGSSGIDIRFNPLICDCRLFPFSFYVNFFRFMDKYNYLFEFTCNDPQSLRGRRVFDVPVNDFNCSVQNDCPPQCLCTRTVSLDLITVVCDKDVLVSIPYVIPKGRRIQMFLHSRNVRELSDRPYFKNVTDLDVSSCSIASINENFLHNFETMKTITITDNSLTTLPKSIQTVNLENLTSLYLHGNPYVCDCHSLWLKSWLKKNGNKIPDLEQVLCDTGPKGKPIVDASDADFVCDGINISLILAISFGGASALVLFVFAIYIFRESIQVFLIANYSCCQCLRRKVATNLPFDIFISYSSHDEIYVQEVLIPNLKKHEFRLFTQDNFIPGVPITENILRGIDSSFTTLIVLSNRFLESDWCKFEFQQAYDKALKERERHLIVLILEEKLDKTLIQGTLKSYLKTNNFIKTSENRYLSRLLLALPRMQVNIGPSETTPLLREIFFQ
ncbi:hypothetical protein CHS0354_041847 [Potamilus streckersoni]|uniref:TIR domain-containing protein n=1 Tax=Potamilus streckersoni TaxID=2493646 RepID=A0AAE0T178_9BIVA|nr:hypothetical protein CHS0354_041847 [Potamilus streckersoni]